VFWAVFTKPKRKKKNTTIKRNPRIKGQTEICSPKLFVGVKEL